MQTLILALSAFAAIAWTGLLAYWFSGNQFRRNGYEPIIDHDALQAELDEEFKPLPIERAARLSA